MQNRRKATKSFPLNSATPYSFVSGVDFPPKSSFPFPLHSPKTQKTRHLFLFSLDFRLETRSKLFIYPFFKIVHRLLGLNHTVTQNLVSVLCRLVQNILRCFRNNTLKLVTNFVDKILVAQMLNKISHFYAKQIRCLPSNKLNDNPYVEPW